MKSAAIVFGMHRSGTSVLSRLLTEIGFAQAQEVLPPQDDNPLGFWEPKAIVALNDAILRELGSWWADPAPFVYGNGAADISLAAPTEFLEPFAELARTTLEAAYGDSPRICIKDPRLCLLWPLWRQVLAGAGYAVHGFYIYRHPFAVAQSLRRRNQFETADGLRLWLRYTLAILQAPRTVDSILAVDFADLHRSPRQALTSLIGHSARVAGTSAKLDPKVVADLVQSDHVHHEWPHDWNAADIMTPLLTLVADADRLARKFIKAGKVGERAVSAARDRYYDLSRRHDMVNPLSRLNVDAKPVLTAAPRPRGAARETVADGARLGKPASHVHKERRAVVFHYHLFKNAGTSVDAILSHNFGRRWLAGEIEAPPANMEKHRAEIRAWILANPDVCAFSSHTALLPEPEIEGIEILPIIFLRHPIDRIYSAYNYERQQRVDTYGANLAKEGDFAHYVRTLLDHPANFAIKNFQSRRLAGGDQQNGDNLEARAMKSLDRLPFVGLVEEFDRSIQKLQLFLQRHFPHFMALSISKNVAHTDQTTLQERLNTIRSLLGGELYERLETNNKVDFSCHRCLQTRFQTLSKTA